MGKQFKKTVENFTCFNCQQAVLGDGFTDHCPNCLWSKHVDINPGDRLGKCGGFMEPVGATRSKGGWRICYCCQNCGYTHFNKISSKDNMNAVIKLSARPIPSFGKLIVITGATVSGKDTLVAEFLKIHPTWRKIITTTTRPIRQNEQNGIDYDFVDLETFRKMKTDGEFLETVEYAGNNYGTTKSALNPVFEGQTYAWIIDASRAAKINLLFDESFDQNKAQIIKNNTVVIYIKLPDMKTRQKHFLKRGMKASEISQRIKQDKMDWNLGNFKNVVINYDGQLDKTIRAVEKIINS